MAKPKIKEATASGGSKRGMRVTADNGELAYEPLGDTDSLFNFAGEFGMDWSNS